MAHSFTSYDGAFLHFIRWRILFAFMLRLYHSTIIPSFHMMAHSFISYGGAYCLHSCYEFITPPSFLHSMANTFAPWCSYTFRRTGVYL